MNSGVYQIRNIKNNKRYIGSSIDIDSRWYRHKKHLRKGVHHSILLQRAWDKDYEGAFVFEILEYVVQCDLSKSEFRKPLLAREQYYKDLYKSYDRKYGYDICKIAGSTLGAAFYDSKAWRQKVGAPHKGKPLSVETKRRISISNTGQKRRAFSEETRRKMSIAFRGRKLSEETKKKMSESTKRYWVKRQAELCVTS